MIDFDALWTGSLRSLISRLWQTALRRRQIRSFPQHDLAVARDRRSVAFDSFLCGGTSEMTGRVVVSDRKLIRL